MSLFRRTTFVTQLSLSVLLVAVMVATALSEEGVKDAEYGPGKKKRIPRRVYWGDTHLHTSFSPDASLAGNIKLGPAEAYKFASGGTVMGHNGMNARLDRALDFLVVSDHAAYLGILPMIREGNPDVMKTKWGKFLSEGMKGGKESSYNAGTAFSLKSGFRPICDSHIAPTASNT